MARAREELDFIAHELARAVGLGGRDRPTASQAERARQNVGRALHKAVRQIAAALPELGAHLERTIHTGAFCSCRPDPEPAVAFLPRAPAPADALPRGTVTFMLTDVEDSARLLAQHRREATRALRRHEELIAAAVPARRGVLLQERGEGSFCGISRNGRPSPVGYGRWRCARSGGSSASRSCSRRSAVTRGRRATPSLCGRVGWKRSTR